MTGTALLLAIAAGACVLTDAHSIELDRSELRMSDIATLDCVAPEQRTAIGESVIAVLAPNQTIELPPSALVALARRRVPGVVLNSDDNDRVAVVFRELAPAQSATLECFAAATPIAAGAPITGDLVAAAPCAGPTTAVRYDRRHGLTRARANLEAGEYIGRLLLSAPVIVEPGQSLSISIGLGNVVVERRVEALQPSTGEAVFVRDSEGHVFPATLAGAVP